MTIDLNAIRATVRQTPPEDKATDAWRDAQQTPQAQLGPRERPQPRPRAGGPNTTGAETSKVTRPATPASTSETDDTDEQGGALVPGEVLRARLAAQRERDAEIELMRAALAEAGPAVSSIRSPKRLDADGIAAWLLQTSGQGNQQAYTSATVSPNDVVSADYNSAGEPRRVLVGAFRDIEKDHPAAATQAAELLISSGSTMYEDKSVEDGMDALRRTSRSAIVLGADDRTIGYGDVTFQTGVFGEKVQEEDGGIGVEDLALRETAYLAHVVSGGRAGGRQATLLLLALAKEEETAVTGKGYRNTFQTGSPRSPGRLSIYSPALANADWAAAAWHPRDTRFDPTAAENALRFGPDTADRAIDQYGNSVLLPVPEGAGSAAEAVHYPRVHFGWLNGEEMPPLHVAYTDDAGQYLDDTETTRAYYWTPPPGAEPAADPAETDETYDEGTGI